MNIFIIGSGGREHAIAWKVLQSTRVKKLFMTATHAGVAELTKNNPSIPIQSIHIAETDTSGLIAFTKNENIDLVIIGSETPLANGLADDFEQHHIAVFGPTKLAAEIESSKAYAKDFMQRHHIPTARYKIFQQFSDAKVYLEKIDYPIVIKASGLAAGKGVFLPENKADAEKIVRALLQDHTLGNAGNEIIIEERLQGEEISLLAFSDGNTVKTMPPARDHKRLYDGNQGPNTGGMGAYASAALLSPDAIETYTKTILQKTIDGLREENRPFIGVLYAGLMLTADGPRVLEFNARFGDPETQVLLPLLETDLLEIMLACVEKYLNKIEVRWKNASATCVVAASENYPISKKIGDIITIEKQIDNDAIIFHAGTLEKNGTLLTDGGRVLAATAWSSTLEKSIQKAYELMKHIHFRGMQYRQDIGKTDAYSAAGVDIHAGNKAVKLMSAAVKSTYGPEVLAGIGAFGGMFDAARIKNMQHPVLVASTDGIGTKVHLGIEANRLNSLGHDIVNHSVNDILVQNARPLFFLDYVATSRLDAEKIAAIVTGMADACRAVHCALLGGETAEMPGIYTANSIDVAGTIVGVVEKNAALPHQDKFEEGDILLGVKSSGPHTNGYSLIRKIFSGITLDTVFPELNSSLADALLAPHRNYLPVLQPALDHKEQPIKALIHITGGGFYENIPRILPQHLSAHITLNSWPIPPLFKLIQEKGNVPTEQMYRIFNMGIGMLMIVAPHQIDLVKKLIPEEVFIVGKLTAGKQEVVIN